MVLAHFNLDAKTRAHYKSASGPYNQKQHDNRMDTQTITQTVNLNPTPGQNAPPVSPVLCKSTRERTRPTYLED